VQNKQNNLGTKYMLEQSTEIITILESIVFWGNSMKDYLVALNVFALTIVVLILVKMQVISRIEAFAKQSASTFDDALVSVMEPLGRNFYIFVASMLASMFLIISDTLNFWLGRIFFVIIAFYTVKVLQKLVSYGIEFLTKDKLAEDKNFDDSLLHLTGQAINILLWVIGLLVVMQNFGMNVTAILGGLGIGGIALAIAVQGVLGDFLASFSIFLDKPFKTGDFIVVGADRGTVQKIGMKSTRIKTLQGDELVIANQELISTRVNNYKKMERRRVVFNVGIPYTVSRKKLALVPQMLEEVIKAQEYAEFERAHFASFGEQALLFEVVYYMKVKGYEEYMDTQQSINLGILEVLEKNEIKVVPYIQRISMSK
jgi:small-conductance mechanosensitive channel